MPAQLARLAVVAALVLAAVAPASRPARAAEPSERGKFRLHKFLQPIGTETYELANEGGAVTLSSKFEFSDRGTAVPLAATLRAKGDLTPVSFEIKGKTSRFSELDTRIEVSGATASVSSSGAATSETIKEPFFTIGGYAPVAMQMAMVRYWLAHGRPATLRTIPLGDVTISDRGEDTFDLNGSKTALRRYSVDGLLWGREWLWLDGDGSLVALVSVDAEFDHFEAVREGYEPLLTEFVTRAARDGMEQLEALARATSPEPRAKYAVVGATLVDGTDRPPVADSVVLVDGERIVAAGPRAKVRVPKGMPTVDGRRKWIVPGLWDLHAHFEQVEWGPVYLAAGVTTVRDCGNELDFLTAVRDAVASHKGVGPRMLLAGIVDGDSQSAVGVVRIKTAEDVAPTVSMYKRASFQQIKIYQSIKPELVPLITAEAHRQGMSVTGHVPSGMTAVQAVEAGLDQINHLQFVAWLVMPLDKLKDLSPEEGAKLIASVDLKSPEAQRVIKTLAEHHTVVDPTMAVREMIWHPASVPVASFEPGAAKLPKALAGPAFGGVPPERVPLTSALFAKYMELLGELHRAGVAIVAGTDQTVPGHSLHREIELYEKAGFTPLEALQSATIVAARAMGMEKELGTVEAGKAADFLLVDADPLATVANIRRISAVVARGRLYEPAPLWKSVGFRP